MFRDKVAAGTNMADRRKQAYHIHRAAYY